MFPRARSCIAGILGVALLGVAGCAGGPRPPDSGQGGADGQPPGTLGPWDGAVRVEAAYAENARLWLRYGVEQTSLQGMADLGAVEQAADPGEMAFLGVVTEVDDQQWSAPVQQARPLQVASPAHWSVLMDRALDELTPARPGEGVVVDFLRQEELFLYRDVSGERRAVPIIFKPPDVPVVGSLDFRALMTRLDGQVRERYPATPGIVFETGDTDPFGTPFVYVAPEPGRVVFLRLAAAWDAADRSGFGGALAPPLLARTFTTQVRAMLTRPVSSVARLFTLTLSATVDLASVSGVSDAGAEIPPLRPREPMDTASWEAELDALTGTVARPGHIEFLVDGPEFFPRLIDSIGSARESLKLRVYIFDNDDYAISIADLLRRRSREIDVQVLFDELGTAGAGQVDPPLLPPDHRPPPSIAAYLRTDSNVAVRSLPNPWLAGDHTKAIIVDRQRAFVGGMNIGREYRYDWHDLMMEVTGPVVAEVVDDFDLTWRRARVLGDLVTTQDGRRAPATGDDAGDPYPVRFLYTRMGNSQIMRAQIAAMRRARSRIFIENAYLASDAVLVELIRARRRGVDVRVIMPVASDLHVFDRSNALAANALLRNGVRVFIYPRMSHVKAALYDDWVCVGSANFDRLSLRVNRELNLATSHPAVTAQLLEQVFVPDFSRSVELEEPLPTDWTHHLSELIADML